MHMHMALKSGGRSVEASGTPLDISFDDQDAAKKFEFLSETLRFRAQKTPEHVLFSLLDSKVRTAFSHYFRDKYDNAIVFIASFRDIKGKEIYQHQPLVKKTGKLCDHL